MWLFDPRGEFSERRRGPTPAQNTRGRRACGKESEPLTSTRERLERPDLRQRFHHLLGLRVGDFAEKLEGQVDALRPRPARVAAGAAETLLRFGQRGTKGFRQVDGDKGAHG